MFRNIRGAYLDSNERIFVLTNSVIYYDSDFYIFISIYILLYLYFVILCEIRVYMTIFPYIYICIFLADMKKYNLF